MTYCSDYSRIIKLAPDGTEKEVAGEDCAEAIKERYSSIVRLEKTFSSHVGHGDWQLLVEQESRWRLKDPSTPIAILITVEDPLRDKNMDIYALIRAEARGRYAAELMTKQQVGV